MPYIHCYVALIIMKKEEIITTLEEQKPTAEMWKVESGCVCYRSLITDRTRRIPQTQPIFFHIPFSDINGNMEHTVKIDDIIQWLV